MCGEGEYKSKDLLECVWTQKAISLKQVDIVMGHNILELHGNHKSKICNRFTKTKNKGTQAYYKRNP